MLSSRLLVASVLFVCFRASESNVYSVLDSLHSMLNYYNNHPENVDSNLIFGVLFVKGEIGVLKNSEDDEIKKDVKTLTEFCDKLLEKHPFDWSVTEYAAYFVEKLSRGKTWKNEELRVATVDYSVSEQLEVGSPSRTDSDMCLFAILIDGEFKDECEVIERDPQAKGYTLLHQAIYYTFKSYMDEGDPLPSRQILHGLCQRILAENKQIMKLGFPHQLQDLFVEQVAVCGLTKYREFLTDSTLRMILSLQTSRGCFAMREKRKHLQVDCHRHLSAVAATALSHFLSKKTS